MPQGVGVGFFHARWFWELKVGLWCDVRRWQGGIRRWYAGVNVRYPGVEAFRSHFWYPVGKYCWLGRTTLGGGQDGIHSCS